MRKMLVLAVPVVLLSFSGNSAFAQDKAAKEKAALKSEVERVTAAFVDAMNSGKYGDVAVYYAEDAMVLPADAPAVKGRAAIKEFWNGMGAAKPTDLKLVLQDLELHGDIALEYGTYSMSLTPPGASAAVADNGKYIVVWKHQSDGSWKLYRDMFSSNLPRQ